MSPTIRDAIDYIARHNELLTNQAIWNIVCKHDDTQVGKMMLDTKCVHAEEVTDVEKINRLMASRHAEMSMWASGNPGALAEANVYMIANAPIPHFKKWQIDVVPGTHFCQMITKMFQSAIEEKRQELREIERRKQEEINRRRQEEFAEAQRIRKLEEANRKYHSPAEVEKRNAVTRSAYNDKCSIYSRKQEFEKALDEIYFLAHAPGDLILKVQDEIPFPRRSKAEKEAFEKAQKPLEPRYEEPLEEDKWVYRPKYSRLNVLNRFDFDTMRSAPQQPISRPIQFHEEKLEVFEKIYRMDRQTYLERFDRALATLNKEVGSIRSEAYFREAKITLKDQVISVSDILFTKNHPYYQFTPLRKELEARSGVDQEAKLAQENKLRAEVEQRNQQRLEGRARDEVRFKECQQTESEDLAEFARVQRLANALKAIQQWNDQIAIKLFVCLYKGEKPSFFGKMHEWVVENRIRSFAQIEEYASGNEDYFESKSRKILRESQSLFTAIRFSPLRMDFEGSSKDEIVLKPIATFINPEESKEYMNWVLWESPKPPSDNTFISEFSKAYLKHTEDRFLPVLFDKMKKWITAGELFSYRQVTHFAASNPTSEVAHLLNTTLQEGLKALTDADQRIQQLQIATFYLHPTMKKVRDVYRKSEDTNRLGVEVIYDFTDYRTERYTASAGRPGLSMHPLNAEADLLESETRLYKDYQQRVLARV